MGYANKILSTRPAPRSHHIDTEQMRKQTPSKDIVLISVTLWVNSRMPSIGEPFCVGAITVYVGVKGEYWFKIVKRFYNFILPTMKWKSVM